MILHTARSYGGGDRLHQNPQCRALLTTAAAAKVYGRAQVSVEQAIHWRGNDDAVLEWLPQETILLEGKTTMLTAMNTLQGIPSSVHWLSWAGK